MTRVVLTDIEGTTTSICFVTDVLFPYARQHIAGFIEQHAEEEEIRVLLEEVVRISGVENKPDSISRQLMQWIDEDKKITPLKALQGMIWRSAYATGGFKGHVYPDVEPVLREWYRQGIMLYVFSSGSVEAQKLLFSYSEAGDLSPLFSGYFDTRIGNKCDSKAYKNLSKEINVKTDEILFLSDTEEELDAAREVGMHTLQLVRDGTKASIKHLAVKNFNEIQFDF